MPINIVLDESLVVRLVVFFWVLNGLAYMALGATRRTRATQYGAFDVFWGILTLIFVLLVLIF